MLLVRPSAAAGNSYVNRRSELYGSLRTLLDPDREDGPFLLPPDARELRAELNILPLRYDSEGKLALPPKQHKGPNSTGEKSIRQLLGRIPDRADALVLAAWMLRLRRYEDDIAERDLVYDDDRELTPEEYEMMDLGLRELIEGADEWARECRRHEIWSDWYDWDD